MDTETLRGIVERVRLVPDRHRVFDQDTPAAMRIFRIGTPALSDLLDLGFPHRSSGGERYFDELDLANASLALRLPSPRYLAMRRWPRSSGRRPTTTRSVTRSRSRRNAMRRSPAIGATSACPRRCSHSGPNQPPVPGGSP